MKKNRWHLYMLLTSLILPVCAAEPVFHFKLDKTLHQKSLTDRSGKFMLVSPQELFLFERGGLRVAEGAQFHIPAEQLPALNGSFTLNAWYFGGARGQDNSVFFRGMLPGTPQIRCGVHNIYPSFYCNTAHGEAKIATEGWGTMVSYPDRKAVVDLKAAEALPGRWSMITWVFGRGKLEIYVNAKLALSKNVPISTLKPDSDPLYIGAVREKGILINKVNSNMIVNDLSLYGSALSGEEIRKLYELDRAKYAGEPGIDSWEKLPARTEYMEALIPGYDPEYKKRLPQTDAWLKNLPEAQKIEGNPVSTIAWDKGAMRLKIGDRLYAPLLYQTMVNVSSDPEYYKKLEDFPAAGFKLNGVMPGSWRDFPHIWKGTGQYDFTLVDRLIRKMIELNPNGRIQVALHPEPNHWFQQKYKDELELYLVSGRSGDQLKIYYTAPLGSDVWLEQCSDMLEALARHVEKQDYAGYVYDYKLFMAGGGEWYWPGCFLGSAVGGYSKATRNTFRGWLREKYKTDAALQKAWNDPSVTLDTAKVPAPEFRLASEHFNFRDPVKARPCYDFRDYMADRTVLGVDRMTSALKRGCGSRKTVTTYYGYDLHYTSSSNATQFISAVFTTERIFRLKSIDHIATPIVYSLRKLGQTGVNLNPFNGSARLHNKLVWHENDLRTHVFPEPQQGALRNWQESCMQIRRGFCLASTMQMGCWFLALPGVHAYTYHETHIIDEMARLQKQADAQLKDDCSSVAEVALIFDEGSMRHTGYNRNRNFLRDHGLIFYDELYHAGAPFDSYLLSDIDNPDMPDYKLYLFVNTYEFTPEKAAKIRRKLRKNHAAALWSYAPGFIGPDGFSTQTMFDLTGIRFGCDMRQINAAFTPNGRKHPITRYTAGGKEYSVGPFLYADDPEAEVLGSAAGKSALAVKQTKDGVNIFSLMPPDRKLMAGIYEFLGIHRYSKGWDVVSCNRSYLMLHSSSAGDKTIELKEPADVTEVFSGEVLGRNVKSFTDRNVPFGTTRYYKITGR